MEYMKCPECVKISSDEEKRTKNTLGLAIGSLSSAYYVPHTIGGMIHEDLVDKYRPLSRGNDMVGNRINYIQYKDTMDNELKRYAKGHGIGVAETHQDIVNAAKKKYDKIIPKFIKSFIERKGASINDLYEGMANPLWKSSGAYSPQLNMLRVRDSLDPAIISHEIGHALSPKILKDTGNIPRMLPRYLLPAAATLGYMGLTEKDDKKAKRLYLGALGAQALMSGQVLADEAWASHKGLKILKELQPAGLGFNNAGRARKLLGNAFGTYAVKRLTPLASMAMAYPLLRYISKQKKY